MRPDINTLFAKILVLRGVPIDSGEMRMSAGAPGDNRLLTWWLWGRSSKGGHDPASRLQSAVCCFCPQACVYIRLKYKGGIAICFRISEKCLKTARKFSTIRLVFQQLISAGSVG